MLSINFAKRARKLVPDLTCFKLEQAFTVCDQGYLVSKSYMWLHTDSEVFLGTGDSKLEAWDALKEEVERRTADANG